MSETIDSSPIPATPVPNVLPENTTLVPTPGFTFNTTGNYQDAQNEVVNVASFIAAMQLALKNAATFAAFQTAMAALPQNP